MQMVLVILEHKLLIIKKNGSMSVYYTKLLHVLNTQTLWKLLEVNIILFLVNLVPEVEMEINI